MICFQAAWMWRGSHLNLQTAGLTRTPKDKWIPCNKDNETRVGMDVHLGEGNHKCPNKDNNPSPASLWVILPEENTAPHLEKTRLYLTSSRCSVVKQK